MPLVAFPALFAMPAPNLHFSIFIFQFAITALSPARLSPPLPAREREFAGRLGAFYRRLAAIKGGKTANKATARKVAESFYLALTKGMKYVEQGIQSYEARYLQQRLQRVQRQAKQLGLMVFSLSLPNALHTQTPEVLG